MRSHVLFISGRSGVGKSTAALALHEQLISLNIQHAVIEGDYLDLAHPAPHEAFPQANLAEQNLASMWSAYRFLGYHRLIYTNTVAALMSADLATAMGENPIVTAVLLRSSDRHAHSRLDRRNHGTSDAGLLDHSAAMGKRLDREAPTFVHRIDTDDLNPSEVAAHLLTLAGWDTQSPATEAH
ncbi:ATPase [Arthrobacter agilis]|uniref:ATPase n=1 Tax=Arthrobacter agilis TaxID=37921 RepID=A0A2L0UGX7_9MICC|nr:adenylyl-sulfate kinase [Arthrobacter agilis]AUZ88504.1 ATPase [Arthrobacter agilis]